MRRKSVTSVFAMQNLSKPADQNDAGCDQEHSDDAGNADLFDRNAKQAEMVDDKRYEHLSGDYQAECHRNAQFRKKHN